MRKSTTFPVLAALGFVLSAASAQAACEGSLGRGWASGNGNGKFEMTTADRSCQMGYASFLNDSTKTAIPATEVALTRTPKSGKLTLNAKGPVYTPNAGFKGQDSFCTRNTTPQVQGKTLSGCVTITVR